MDLAMRSITSATSLLYPSCEMEVLPCGLTSAFRSFLLTTFCVETVEKARAEFVAGRVTDDE